jgi:5-(aminomethyl)-3-furanmethanol phosphate kinase
LIYPLNRQQPNKLVIKLGGSLASAGTLKHCLDSIETGYANQEVVVVPGGGLFAEQVRLAQSAWQFDNMTAHHMAILAMQQMALLFKALKPHFTLTHHMNGFNPQSQQPTIWSPNPQELDAAHIPASWEVTSDSLAAWLAWQIGANALILVKSVPIDADWNLVELTRRGIVDAAFNQFCQQAPFNITLIQADRF